MTTTPRDVLLSLPPERRRAFLNSLPEADFMELARLERVTAGRWAQWADDPLGFVTECLGESVWSKQREILDSVRVHKRTAVPACHAPGKTWLAARIIAWWVAVHPPETVRVVTTATTFRQVRGVLWPHIRRLHADHELPGDVLMTEWQIDGIPVADGFSPADHNEAAVQGIHAENLLVVVDEAGGISNTIGQALEALMTGGHTRLLLLGNPPTDSMGSWFERACNSDLYNVIPIDAYSTPNFTGEAVGDWAHNLVDRMWVDDVTREFGEDSPFVQARVHARFPRNVSNAVAPVDWIEAALVDAPGDDGVIRLGVDVAADGGDEFAIARADGMTVTVTHSSKGNDSAVTVAGTILDHVREAQEAHAARGIAEAVRVKIDAIGVGWGVASLLEEWGKEGQHAAEIVAVNVAERAHDNVKFANQRAEMWWTLRQLLDPNDPELSLCVDRRTVAQLAAPTYRSNSSGRIQIESKADMKRRGVSSPDRAEAVLLAVFDPPRRNIPAVPPLSIPQTSAWF